MPETCPTCGRPRWNRRYTYAAEGECFGRNGKECVLYATVALYSDALYWLRATGHEVLVRSAIEVAKYGWPELHGEDRHGTS